MKIHSRRALSLIFGLISYAFSPGARADQKVEKLGGVGPYLEVGKSDHWRRDTAGAVIDDVVYIAGGSGGEPSNNDAILGLVEAYHPASGAIVPRAPMRTPRTKFGLAAVGGRLYAIGGAGSAGPLSSVEEYDPKKNTWKFMAPMKVARSSLSVGVVDGIVYAVGGWDGKQYSSAVEAYDPRSNSWNTKARLLAPVATRDAIAVANGKMYVLGGMNEAFFQQVQLYFPKEDAWLIDSDLPVDIKKLMSVEVVGGTIYAFYGDQSATSIIARSLESGDWAAVTSSDMWPMGAFAVADSSGTIYGPGSVMRDIKAYRPRVDFRFRSIGRVTRQIYRPDAQIAAQLLFSDVDSINDTRPKKPNDFALIIGIDKYRSIPAADFAERDAAVFRRYAVSILGVPEKNAILLTGDRARRADIAKYLDEWLPRNVETNSRVYFYFSGHGAPEPTKGVSYLVPWDGDPEFLQSSGYSIAQLYRSLETLKAKEILVSLDACFSGEGGRSVIAKGLRPLVTVVDAPLSERSKLSVLTAARSDEVAGSEASQGHGLFTYFLLKGLKGEADADKAGHITLARLHAYIQKSVQGVARRNNRDQTPQVYSSSMGMILR